MKWLLPEPQADAAREVLESGEELIAPGLIRIEVAGAVIRKFWAGAIDAQLAGALLEDWFQALDDGVLGLVSDRVDLRHAAELALSLNHPIQDCLYLAAAVRLDASLLTADQRFHALASPTHPRVTRL